MSDVITCNHCGAEAFDDAGNMAHRIGCTAEYFAELRATNTRLQARVERLEGAARHWLESTDDSCQCGYFEEAATPGNEEGWAVCGPCAMSQALSDKGEEG